MLPAAYHPYRLSLSQSYGDNLPSSLSEVILNHLGAYTPAYLRWSSHGLDTYYPVLVPYNGSCYGRYAREASLLVSTVKQCFPKPRSDYLRTSGSMTPLT